MMQDHAQNLAQDKIVSSFIILHHRAASCMIEYERHTIVHDALHIVHYRAW